MEYLINSIPLKEELFAIACFKEYALNRNICQIHFIYTRHGFKCSSKINTVPIEEYLATTTFVKKETLYSEGNYSRN